jgi:NAD(P)H-hydrate epimerase
MATGGCGDLLTGTIAALLGQGATPAQASRLAVLIHGKAGDMASENHGENGLIATDLLNHIGPVMRNLPLD